MLVALSARQRTSSLSCKIRGAIFADAAQLLDVGLDRWCNVVKLATGRTRRSGDFGTVLQGQLGSSFP